MLDNLEDDKICAKKKRKKKKKNDKKVESIGYDRKNNSSSSTKTKKHINKKIEQSIVNNKEEPNVDKLIKENINEKNEKSDISIDDKNLGDKIKKEKKKKKKKKKKNEQSLHISNILYDEKKIIIDNNETYKIPVENASIFENFENTNCSEQQMVELESAAKTIIMDKSEKNSESKNEEDDCAVDETEKDERKDELSENFMGCNKIEKNNSFEKKKIYEIINKEAGNMVEYNEKENSQKKLPRNFSLIKEKKKEEIIPTNIKYLGTIESNICIINSFHDLSSISCEEKIHDSCSDSSFVYQNLNENFNLYIYIKENSNNYKQILKKNLDIYEKKYVEEIISLLENILKLLIEKKTKDSILTFQKEQIQESQNQIMQKKEIYFSNSSEEDNEEIIKNFEKYNYNSVDESDEQKDVIYSNKNINKKVLPSKKGISLYSASDNNNNNVEKIETDKNKSLSKKKNRIYSNVIKSENISSSFVSNLDTENSIRKKEKKIDEENLYEYIKKDTSTYNDTQTIKLFKNEQKFQIKNDIIDSEIEDDKDKLTKIFSENQQIDKEENENSENIFETIFKCYITDNQIKKKGNKKENINNENDNNLRKMNTEINGDKTKGMMNLELFLTFTKNYKIIKNLLTKNELEKIFINECKGSIYITSKQFKKILIVCGQIAFTKPPHKNNYTDTKKIYSLLTSWLVNNSPEHQKPKLMKYIPLNSCTFLNDSNKNHTTKSRDAKYNILKSSKSSISFKDKYKKK
ncbi:conserved Plasmodium protein, unknown function [Plasmodium berghei]|uniref:Uncharacterized protein n=2 Tax=Plasmodium berghei TaxID=5821 RepID=A0A509AS88_PLABA|nr:conserved Plasmodium protein, unknown function [Plasmodium berghei ANKA]CXI96091.1 conserved Plasmodium protein, unknown function [Plasmodium berghei]VUC57695.1 conserved Plasmodium protein, unknown function [Plasmodium berghei ANKA]|eukprot:XP_034423465.1 conserved Plasmodium protein, unknown function [Plasmodium berghei ANKA]